MRIRCLLACLLSFKARKQPISFCIFWIHFNIVLLLGLLKRLGNKIFLILGLDVNCVLHLNLILSNLLEISALVNCNNCLPVISLLIQLNLLGKLFFCRSVLFNVDLEKYTRLVVLLILLEHDVLKGRHLLCVQHYMIRYKVPQEHYGSSVEYKGYREDRVVLSDHSLTIKLIWSA